MARAHQHPPARHAAPGRRSGWHLLADADELHTYPSPPHDVVAAAEASGHRVVGGLLLDRVAVNGRLAPWRAEEGLDRAFPFGGHLTHRLLCGDPRKIVLVRTVVAVASGNHRAPGHKPDPDALAVVHHFKWRAGVLDDLRRPADDRAGSARMAPHTRIGTGERGWSVDRRHAAGRAAGRHHRLGQDHPREALVARGMVRVSVDEEVHRLHGRYGVDYPEHEYFARERPSLTSSAVSSLTTWRPAATSCWTTGCGGATSATRGRRPSSRLAGGGGWCTCPPTAPDCCGAWTSATGARMPTALTVTASALDDFFARFEPPADDVGATVYTGEPNTVR